MELHTSPKNWLQKKSNCIAVNSLMAQVYQTFIFDIKIDIPTIWGLGTPSFIKQLAEMC